MLQKTKEERAIILDFLPNGYPADTRPLHMKNPVAQAFGKDHFTLLELVPKKGIFLQPNEEVYIGDGKRDKIHHIVGRLPYNKLTQTAQFNLETLVKDIVEAKEQVFVDFFNKSQPINTRRHQIELIPGIGKKHMWQILEEREKKSFESFSDIKHRIKLLPDPEKSVIKRILIEIKGDDKYSVFVRS